MIPGPGEMSDGGGGPCPQVFVVDGLASRVPSPAGKRAWWSRGGQKLLLLLTGLTLLGLVVQANLIYILYKKVEAFSHCAAHPLCRNVSSPTQIASGQQGGTWSLIGPEDDSDISRLEPQIQKRPFAQFIGSNSPIGENNVVQWEHKDGETFTHHMGYSQGRLLVQEEGHYYLYSKVTYTAECSLGQHKVMKVTKAYDQAIELLKSRSFRCTSNPKSSSKSPNVEELQNSFLAGTFHLLQGDEVYVTLEDIQKIYRGTTDNVMGAFMIAP